MRKQYLLWMALLIPSWQLSAQTYCTPTGGASSQSSYLKKAVLSDQGAVYYDAASYQAYVDNSGQMVHSYPGGAVNVYLEHANWAKSYVWVDWNADGDFDDFYENPIEPSSFSVVDEPFFVPPNQAPGIYRIRVQSSGNFTNPVNPCGPENYGGFVDFSLKIDPAPTCLAPTTLAASNITNSTALMSWEAPSTLPGSGYEYYYTPSATPPTASTPASGTTMQTSAPISGLAAFTPYYIYARAVCDTSNKSAWSLRGTFTTKCDPMSSMFESFENVPNNAQNANCWDKIGTGYMTIGTSSGVNNSKGVTQSALNADNVSIAVLPMFSNVNAGTHWLRFKAKISSNPGILDIGYLTNDADVSTFNTIQSVNITNKTFDGYEYNVVIPSTVPANTRLAIRHGGVPSVNIYWDEVYWEPKPSCLPTGTITTSNITSSTVDIAWTASASSPAGYDVYYSQTNTPPTAGTTPNISNVPGNSYTINNLASAKTYYIWVRPRCSNTDQGPWSSVATILTACAPVPDLFENFDSYNNGLLTNAPCWGRLTVGIIASANIDGNTPAASGTKHISLRSISTGDIAIAVLPEFSNVNAGTHQLRFKAYSTLPTGKLKIGYVTDPANASSFVLIQQLDIANTSYNTNYYKVSIPTTVPANARLAIRSDYETSAKAAYFVDDIYWETGSLGTAEVSTTPEFTVYPNPFTDVINISAGQKVTSMAVYDRSGKLTREIANPSAAVSLKDLPSGVYIIRLIFKNGTAKTIKAVKK
ncbi:fibronectin type III domain-containing protein [Chryseobacterium sp.]|uniref:fibronectin type III domain-containing protein n=1 Tax=Chryseobacterium sp. TaxID=1871047 RepID=UPI0032193E32